MFITSDDGNGNVSFQGVKVTDTCHGDAETFHSKKPSYKPQKSPKLLHHRTLSSSKERNASHNHRLTTTFLIPGAEDSLTGHSGNLSLHSSLDHVKFSTPKAATASLLKHPEQVAQGHNIQMGSESLQRRPPLEELHPTKSFQTCYIIWI